MIKTQAVCEEPISKKARVRYKAMPRVRPAHGYLSLRPPVEFRRTHADRTSLERQCAATSMWTDDHREAWATTSKRSSHDHNGSPMIGVGGNTFEYPRGRKIRAQCHTFELRMCKPHSALARKYRTKANRLPENPGEGER
jgi:hypothetical protein